MAGGLAAARSGAPWLCRGVSGWHAQVTPRQNVRGPHCRGAGGTSRSWKFTSPGKPAGIVPLP